MREQAVSKCVMPNQIAASPEDGLWESLPDHILLEVFYYLKAGPLLQAAQVCTQWRRVAHDEFLWKELLCLRWIVDRSCHLAPNTLSWFEEYKRLYYHTPCQETEVLTRHRDQVLHVSFSHDGKYFATSSKDGFVKVWCTSYPCEQEYSQDMHSLHWKYTQFTQFNSTDKLLLVSGVHFGSHSTSGEIAIFNMEDNFKLECRVQNKPYDIFGTWYNETHLLSGNLHWLGNFTSCSVLWLNKAHQASESERENVVMRLFKFQNVNASSVRTILVADCLDNQATQDSNNDSAESTQDVENMEYFGLEPQGEIDQSEGLDKQIHSQSSQGTDSSTSCKDTQNVASTGLQREAANGQHDKRTGGNGSDNASVASRQTVSKDSVVVDDSKSESGSASDVGDRGREGSSEESDTCGESGTVPCSGSGERPEPDKYLIFTTGSLTYTPHQIGIKRIRHQDAIGKMQKLAQERYSRRLQQRSSTSEESDGGLAHSNGHVLMDMEQQQQLPQQLHEEDAMRMDPVDHLIELNGHIIGFCLSEDSRYLYVNTRAWPENYQIADALEPPPIAQEIEIHVIDLLTITDLGVMHTAHKAFTPNDECFFIFLDVSRQYVASGAEDKHAYLWDRHYRSLLHTYSHEDVVNSVAFHPSDPETLVTVSDDNKIKVWRSRHRCETLGLILKQPDDLEPYEEADAGQEDSGSEV